MPASEKPTVTVSSSDAPPAELQLDDVVVGDGDEAVSGRPVSVHYVGVAWSDGQEFDSSWGRNELFRFGLGRGEVIKGWDDGVVGMRVGGRRRITIPPDLGYGAAGAGGVIKGGETLVFVVDLVAVH
jgi:peptidylprolyl isomerase